MAEMKPIERIQAVLRGEKPDRPPVGFWHHFPPDAMCGRSAVDAHLEHLNRYDLDFLKIMNDNPYPTQLDVRRAADLQDIPILSGTEEGFTAQLDLIETLADELEGRVPLVTTIFSSWSVLRKIVTPPTTDGHLPPSLDAQPAPPDVRLSELLTEDRTLVGMALEAISQSLANFVRHCLKAGADGIFLSVREDRVNNDANGPNTYTELARDGDRQILSVAAEGTMNMLHVCGAARNLETFAAYPIHVINWADRAAGPAIKDVIRRIEPVVCAGVDNLKTLPEGTCAQVTQEVLDALQQAGDRPMIVSPGCTYDPETVPPENLEAMAQAVRG
ncbi:MAG: hypothetical protein IH987_08665 [Planctomycetes bacterium]|nr:hypothetical protein [Planctomycetota bacterium]